MSFQLNTQKATQYALPKSDAEAVNIQLNHSVSKRVNTGINANPAVSKGIAIQQKVIQLQSAQFNVRNAKDLLSTAEVQLNGLKELFTRVRQRVAEANCECETFCAMDAASESIEGLSVYLSVFENTLESSLSGMDNYKNMLDTKDEFLTSAIANSTASVSRMFDTD